MRETIELRVHGVGGASPETLLRTTGFRQVWGDRIAGFFAADAEQRGRRVEAYCWGGMTSRGGYRVLWMLLFPFMLANLAGWMCSARTRADPWTFAVHRACGRLAAVATTLNLLLIVVLTTTLWAYQLGCRPVDPSASRWKRAAHDLVVQRPTGRGVVVVAAVAAAALVVLSVLSRQTRRRYEQVTPTGRAGRERGTGSAAALPGGVADRRFFDGSASVRRLGLLHVSTGLAGLGLLVAYFVGSVPLMGAGAAAMTAALALLACEEAGERLVVPLVWAVSALAGGTAAYAWFHPYDEGTSPQKAVAGTYALIFALVFARLAAVPLTKALRWRHRPPRGNGPGWPGAPFVVAALGVLSLNAIGLGCVAAVARAVGAGGRPTVPGDVAREAVLAVTAGTMPWLILVPVGVVAAFALIELARYHAAGDRRTVDALAAHYAGRTAAGPVPRPAAWWRSAVPSLGQPDADRDRAERWVRSIARSRKAAGFSADSRYLLSAVAAAAVLAAGVFGYLQVKGGRTGQTGILPELAMSIAALTPMAGMAMLRWGWGRSTARRGLGVLWDVGTFWPRSFHPFAPPCYAERAVPDLQRRLRWLQDTGGRVVVVAHSQGSVLVAAALAQSCDDRPREHRPTLVTCGSPLATLYRWAFPAYFDDRLLDRLAGDRDETPVRRWRNFYTRTDYIGGPVGRDGVDRELPDPDSAWYVAGEPLPRIRRHTGYWTNDTMWTAVDRLAPHTYRAWGQDTAPARRAVRSDDGIGRAKR